MTTTSIPAYLIFTGDVYYPLKGFNDLYGSASTLDEATEIAKEAVEIGRHRPLPPEYELPPDMKDELAEAHRIASTTRDFTKLTKIYNTYRLYDPPEDWAQIVELKTMKIVADVTNEKHRIPSQSEPDPEAKYKRVANFVWH